MTIIYALQNLNNAVSDLESSDFNTYERPLRKVSEILNSDELNSITEKLKSGVNFDEFLANAHPGRGMMGSARLIWPTEQEKELGLTILLIEKGANPSLTFPQRPEP